VRYLYGTNIRENRIDLTGLRYVTHEFDDKESKTRLREGDLLTVQSGHIGTTAVVPSELEGANCHALIVTRLDQSQVNPAFLSQYLNSEIGTARMRGLEVGSTILHINTKDLKRFRIPLPPLPEQRKIAAILSTWDRAIELSEKLIAAKQKRKQALMQQLLTGKVRLPGFEKSVWKNCHLSDVAKNSTRRNGTSPDQATVYSVTNSVGMIPMDEGVIGENIERYKTVSHFDFAYNPMRINVGSIAMWDGNEDVLVSPDYVVFRCGPKLDAEFLEQFRQTHYWRHFVTRAGGGSVRVRIYFNDLAAMKLNLPSLDEQKAIAAVLNAQDKELQLIERRLNALKQQKRGLMQQLLTGKVRVNVDAETVKG
jgi:type I restriction enzyme S subunit